MSENYMRLMIDKYHRDRGKKYTTKYLDNFRKRFLTLGQYKTICVRKTLESGLSYKRIVQTNVHIVNFLMFIEIHENMLNTYSIYTHSQHYQLLSVFKICSKDIKQKQ